MGETDDSPNAARCAQTQRYPGDGSRNKGVLRRIATGWLDRLGKDEIDQQIRGEAASGLPEPVKDFLETKRVDDAAIPSVEIVAVPVSISKDELVRIFRDSGKSRVPVYDGTLDTPLGFIHLKDFALRHGFNGNDSDFRLAKMLRPLLFVPSSMRLGTLLTKMQTERRHMALVIDEYGGVEGLLTIEDLIEQVVGAIQDEHDNERNIPWRREKPGHYVALAKTPLDEFQKAIGFSLADDSGEEEIDTLGGLVFMLAGRVPARGEIVQHPNKAEFEIIDADPRRIKRLRVRLPEKAA